MIGQESWTLYAPTVLAPAARAGEVFEASWLELPAAENERRVSFMISLTTRRKLTDGEVNTTLGTVSDRGVDGIAGRTTKGEVDNGRLARGDSVVHSGIDSTDNIREGA